MSRRSKHEIVKEGDKSSGCCSGSIRDLILRSRLAFSAICHQEHNAMNDTENQNDKDDVTDTNVLHNFPLQTSL